MNELGEKRRHKDSALANSSTRSHASPKRNKLETIEPIVVQDYYKSLITECGCSRGTNCLLDYFNNCHNSLYDFAEINSINFNKMNKETFEKHRSTIVKNLPLKNESINSHISYHVRYKTNEKDCIINCCRTCFRNVYLLTEYKLNKINGLDDNQDINFKNSKSDNLERISGQELAEYFEESNINAHDFHLDYLPAIMCPKGAKAERCVAWLFENFLDYGDRQPNSKIIYVPDSRKLDVYEDYSKSDEINDPVSLNDFYNIWKNCYPYILLRQQCNIIGKCDICAAIENLRKSSNPVEKEAGKRLHGFHRGLFVNERIRYQERTMHAIAMRYLIASFAIDVMDSYKLKTPNLGRQSTFGKPFSCVIVGIITHGTNKTDNIGHRQTMQLFRTWNSISKTQNLIVHCFLEALDKWISTHGNMYPKLIYLQVDGGSENANHTFFCHVQHLVNLLVCNKIVYTRLPTGHGHLQDIDGGFGVVKTVLTNQPMPACYDFDKLVRKNLSSENCRLIFYDVKNLYLINDWEMYYDRFYSKVQFIYKQDQTMHQFIFEATSGDVNHPTNVLVSCRSYASPKVLEIIECNKLTAETDLAAISGLQPVEVFVGWFNKDENGNPLTFLNDIPGPGEVPLLSPVQNCVTEVDDVMSAITNSTIASITSDMKKEYQEMRKRWLPVASENVTTYAHRVGFRTPKWALFSGNEVCTLGQAVEPKITPLVDDNWNAELDILRALTQNTIRQPEKPVTRAFIPSSSEAVAIQKSIVDHDQFKAFDTYVQHLGKPYKTSNRDLSTFLLRYNQCKISLHGLLKFQKPKNLDNAHRCLMTAIASFLLTFYSPLLGIYKKSTLDALSNSPDSVVSRIEGFGNVRVKHLKTFGINTINILVAMFNLREEAIYKVYTGDAPDDDDNNDEEGQQRLVQPKTSYHRIKFENIQKVVGIFDGTLEKESLPSSKDYSQVIYPFRYQVSVDNKIFFPIALIVVNLKEKKLLFLDPYMADSDAASTLHNIKEKFDSFYGCNFNSGIYHTISKEIVTDKFEKLPTTCDDYPIIYMYVMIYYVIYSCPIIFKATDVQGLGDKIRCMILKETFFI